MRTISIMKANKWFLLFLIFGTFRTLNAQVQDSLAINTGNVASAIGFQTQATGNYSLSTGYQSIASGMTTTAIGYSDSAIGTRSVAIGDYNVSRGDQSYTFGQGNKAFASQSLAIGRFMETYASGAIALGSCTSAYRMGNGINNSLMIGFMSKVPTFYISEAEQSIDNNGIGKVGIGTTNPVARLQVADGDIFIQDIDKGIIMKSPDGSCWRGTMNNTGQLEFVKLSDCVSLTANTNEGTEINSTKVFPNPSKEYFEIRCSESDCLKYNTVSLYGISGDLVFSQPFNSETNIISTSSLKSGSYVLKLNGRHDSFTDIVIITH